MKSKMIKGNKTIKGVLTKDSILNSSRILFEVGLIIDKSAAGSVPDINALNSKIRKMDSTLKVNLKNNEKNIILRNKRVRESFNAFVDNASNFFNLNLEAASKIIITKARMLIEVRNTGGKEINGASL